MYICICTYLHTSVSCYMFVTLSEGCCNVSALLQCVAVYYPFCRTSLLGLRDRKMSVCLSVCPCLSSPRLYPKGSICEGLVSCSDLHFHLAPRRTFLCGVYLSNHANDKLRVLTWTVFQADICIVSVCLVSLSDFKSAYCPEVLLQIRCAQLHVAHSVSAGQRHRVPRSERIRQGLTLSTHAHKHEHHSKKSNSLRKHHMICYLCA